MVGTNILGYSHPEIDDAVKEAAAKGIMSTLNAPEEVWLAEKLLEEIHGLWCPLQIRRGKCTSKNC